MPCEIIIDDLDVSRQGRSDEVIESKEKIFTGKDFGSSACWLEILLDGLYKILSFLRKPSIVVAGDSMSSIDCLFSTLIECS